MKRSMELTVWAKPEPQRRARHSTRGGIVRTYSHPRDKAYRAQIIEAYQREFWNGEAVQSVMFPRGTDLLLSLIAHVPCPAGISTKRRREGRAGRPQGSTDLSNIVKAVEDALQGFAYWNDKQIKEYRSPFWIQYAIDLRTGEDTPPHLWIRLEEM